MTKLYFLKAHPVRHLHIGQLLLIVERRWPILFHGFVGSIAVDTIFTLALARTFDAIRITGTVFLIALSLLTGAELAIRILSLHHIAYGRNSLCPLLRLYFILAILAPAQGCTHSIILEALAVGLQALTLLASAELALVSH